MKADALQLPESHLPFRPVPCSLHSFEQKGMPLFSQASCTNNPSDCNVESGIWHPRQDERPCLPNWVDTLHQEAAHQIRGQGWGAGERGHEAKRLDL